MMENVVGEEDSRVEEGTGSPMWKYLKEEYDYKRPQRGDILYAEVIRIDEDEIIVDIGGKTEGVVPSADLDRMGEEALADISLGDKVPVYVLRPESADGGVIVSLNMARTMEDWRRAEKLHEEGGVFEGTVSGHNKGGLLVYYGKIRGFVPASQVAGLGRRTRHESRMEMLAKMEGQKLMLKVIEVDRQRRRLIFSERAASREWREKRKEELLDELQEGDIRTGRVRNLCDFGAFVDLGGADGLIHISELAWRRVKHPREVLRVSEEVEVYVLRVDRERKRIGLSLKRLRPDPWQLVEETYEPGQIVKGVITNVVDFGAFARIEEGIEGLIHISELADGDFSPSDLVREGEELYLKILSIDAGAQRMGLSLKQAPTREEVEGEEALAEEELEGELEAIEEAALELEEEPEAAAEALEEAAVTEVTAEPELEAPVVEEVEAEVEVVEAEAEAEEELEAAEPELEAPVVEEVEAEAEVLEAEAEAEEEPEAAAEPELEAPVVEEVEAEAEVVEAEAEAEEELEAAEPELEAPVVEEVEAEAEVVEAEAEAEEELEAAEPELEAPVVEEVEAEVEVAEAEAEAEEELEVAAEPELEAPVVEEVEAEVEVVEAEAEAEEELEAAEPELEAPVVEEVEAEVEVVEAEAEAEEELETAAEPELEAPVAEEVEAEAEVVEAEAEAEEELETAAEPELEAPVAEEVEAEAEVAEAEAEADADLASEEGLTSEPQEDIEEEEVPDLAKEA